MDRLNFYRKTIRTLLEKYVAEAQPRQANHVVQLVTDDEHHQYLLFHNGWVNERRQYGCFLHLSIQQDKIYIEYDGTDFGFATLFLEAGIPKTDIVLAFQAPSKRPYTGFAVA